MKRHMRIHIKSGTSPGVPSGLIPVRGGGPTVTGTAGGSAVAVPAPPA